MELQKKVGELIELLSENDREILALRHAEGLSNLEVAEIFQMDPNSVRQRHGRAVRRLHSLLAQHGIDVEDVMD